MLLAMMMACTTETDSGEPAGELPTITFLTPAEGEVVAAGDYAVSLIVEDFTFESPEKHSGSGYAGFLVLSLDGTEVGQLTSTQTTVSLDVGAHTLSAQLFYADGDAIDPEVVAEVGFTAE